MGKTRETSSETAAQIVALRNGGFTQTKISAQLGIQQSVVSRILKRYSETGQLRARKRSGRPRCTSQRTDLLIKRIVTVTPTATSSYIKAMLPDTEAKISKTTIKRRLHDELQLRAFRPVKKPLLSKKNISDRLAFCKRYKSWTVDQWQKVLFSDETMLRQFASYVQHVRRPPGQRNSARYLSPKVSHSPSVMIWGCISAEDRGGLWIMPEKETVTANAYLRILQEKLPVWMPQRHCSVFQQDGAPAHTSKMVKNWLGPWLQNNGYTMLSGWPGNSPDLNVIENAWVILKKKVAELKPTSRDDLIDKIKQVWVQNITEQYCKDLCDSMPRRIEAVLAAKGHSTKY